MKKLLRSALIGILCAALLFAAVPLHHARAEYAIATGTVNTGKLNLRSGPGITNGIVDTLNQGETVSIYEVAGDWLRIDAQRSGQSGYVYGKYITLDGTSISAYGFAITTGKVHLREEATSKSTSLAIVPKGAAVTVYYATDSTGFYRVRVHGTLKDGFISPLYLKIITRVQPIDLDTTKSAGYVNASNVNFRTGPGLGYLVLDTLAKRTQVMVLDAGISWYKVQLKSTGVSGYIYARYVTVTSAESTPAPTPQVEPDQGTIGWLNAGGVNFRTGPSVKYESVDVLSKNTLVWYQGKSGNWLKVTLVETKQDGYIFSKFVSFPEPTPTPTVTP